IGKAIKATVVFQLGDQAEERVGTDINERKAPGTHRAIAECALGPASKGTNASTPSVFLTQASISDTARYAIISFWAFFRKGADRVGSKPKFTFIGWKVLRAGSVIYLSKPPSGGA